MVVHYRNQKYSQLRRDHQGRGELFTDPTFPPANESLFLSGKSEKEVVWKRPGVREGGREGRREEGRGEGEKGVHPDSTGIKIVAMSGLGLFPA